MKYTLTLPHPPSINGYWRAIVRGRTPAQIISAKGREFRSQAKLAVRLARRAPKGLDGRLKVGITLNAPDRRRRDIDNYTKAVLDALTHAGVWEDDSQIDELRVTRGTVGKPGSTTVVIEEVAA